MKKEKQVRSYKRRTKSGKTITVKAHTAKYDAADEKAKNTSKKEGAGKELEERKKKPTKLEIPFNKEEEKKVLDEVKDTAEKKAGKKSVEKNAESKVSSKTQSVKKSSGKKTTSSTTSSAPFTRDEFKEWYRGTGSAADKKVAKALRAQLGRAGYRKLEDEATANYSSRGHLSMFKKVSGGSSSKTTSKQPTTKAMSTKTAFSKEEYKKAQSLIKELKRKRRLTAEESNMLRETRRKYDPSHMEVSPTGKWTLSFNEAHRDYGQYGGDVRARNVVINAKNRKEAEKIFKDKYSKGKHGNSATELYGIKAVIPK